MKLSAIYKQQNIKNEFRFPENGDFETFYDLFVRLYDYQCLLEFYRDNIKLQRYVNKKKRDLDQVISKIQDARFSIRRFILNPLMVKDIRNDSTLSYNSGTMIIHDKRTLIKGIDWL